MILKVSEGPGKSQGATLFGSLAAHCILSYSRQSFAICLLANFLAKTVRKGIALLLLAILLLTACSGKTTNMPARTPAGPAGEQVSIHFAVPDWDLAWGPWDGLVEEFEAQNPGIHVELESFNEILDLPPGEFHPAEDFWFKLASSSDVFQVIFYDGIARQAVREGLVRDLKPFMDADPNFRAGDFYPGALEAAAWDGGVWAMPTALDYEVILFDKEAFDAAGVTRPEIGWTWDDFEVKARALAVRSGDQVTRWGFVRGDFSFRPARLVELRTGPLLDDATTPPTPRFTEAEVEAVAQWWVGLALDEQVMPHQPLPDPTDGESTWIEQGIAAMSSGTVLGSTWVRHKQPQKVGVVPYPVDALDSRTTPVYLSQAAMSAGTAHPKAAWRWLDFVSRQPPGNSGQIPARRSVAEMAGFWDDLDEETAATLQFAMDHAVLPSPLKSDWYIAYEDLNVELRAALDGVKSVKEALAAAQSQAISDLAAKAAQRAAATPIPVAVATAEPPPVEGAVTVAFIPMGDALGIEPFRDAASRFHTTHPDVAVEVKNPNFSAGSIANLAGQADCFQSIPNLDNPATLTAILSLEPFLEAERSFDLDDFFAPLLDQYRRSGQTWGLPAEVQPYVIEYNQDLFDAAGQAYPESNWTMDDFLILAQGMAQGEGENQQYGFVGDYEMLDLLMFVERLGGRVLDDTQDPPAAAFDAPATVEAVQWYANLHLLHGVKPVFITDEERETLINDGRAAMWAVPFSPHDELRSGVLPFPQGAPEAGAPIINAKGYFISAGAAAPQACWEWIKFLTAETSITRGLPARRSIAASETYLQQVGAERAAAYLASVESSRRPSIVQRIAGQEWIGAYLVWLEGAYRQIVEEGTPPAQALAAAQEKADDYRACIVANESLNDPQGYQACMSQVDSTHPETPSENP